MKKTSKYILLIFLLYPVIHAQQQDSLKINYNYINSVPQNAEVYLNNVLIGQTPLYFVTEPDAAERKIIIKLKGYADFSYMPLKDELINETIKLVPLKKNINTEIVHENKSYAFPKKLNVVPLLLSSAVTAVSAVLAYYYKSLAIDKQEEFEATGDASLIDKKKKYDVIGGISMAVFQLGFGALLYFHFIE